MGVFWIVAHALLWAAVLVQALVIGVLVYQLAEIRRALDQVGHFAMTDPLPIASDAPTFNALDLRTAKSVSSKSFLGRPVALLFLSTDCSICRGLARELKKEPAAATQDLVVYCNGATRSCQSLVVENSSLRAIRKDSESLAALFRLHGFPVLVLIDQSWKVIAFRYPSRVVEILDALASLKSADEVTRATTTLANVSTV